MNLDGHLLIKASLMLNRVNQDGKQHLQCVDYEPTSILFTHTQIKRTSHHINRKPYWYYCKACLSGHIINNEFLGRTCDANFHLEETEINVIQSSNLFICIISDCKYFSRK